MPAKRARTVTIVAPSTQTARNSPTAIIGRQVPSTNGNSAPIAIATASAQRSRVHRSGSGARRHAASGPIAIRNTSGAMKIGNRKLK